MTTGKRIRHICWTKIVWPVMPTLFELGIFLTSWYDGHRNFLTKLAHVCNIYSNNVDNSNRITKKILINLRTSNNWVWTKILLKHKKYQRTLKLGKPINKQLFFIKKTYVRSNTIRSAEKVRKSYTRKTPIEIKTLHHNKLIQQSYHGHDIFSFQLNHAEMNCENWVWQIGCSNRKYPLRD